MCGRGREGEGEGEGEERPKGKRRGGEEAQTIFSLLILCCIVHYTLNEENAVHAAGDGASLLSLLPSDERCVWNGGTLTTLTVCILSLSLSLDTLPLRRYSPYPSFLSSSHNLLYSPFSLTDYFHMQKHSQQCKSKLNFLFVFFLFFLGIFY